MSPLFNTLSRFVIASLSKHMHLLIVTICSDFGTQENKICHCFHFFPICLPWRDVTDALILVFWMLSFKPVFSLSSFTLIKGLYYISMYRDIYNYGYIPYMYIHTCICIGRDLLLVLSLSRTWTNTLCDRPEPVFWFFFFNFFFLGEARAIVSYNSRGCHSPWALNTLHVTSHGTFMTALWWSHSFYSHFKDKEIKGSESLTACLTNPGA